MGKFLLVVVVFAAVVYTFFWLLERRRTRPVKARPQQPRVSPRMVAPDDDEDFLRELERRRRRAARHKPGDQQSHDPDSGPGDKLGPQGS